MRPTCLFLLFALALLLAACGDDSGINGGNSRYTETDWFYKDDVVREIRITINTDIFNNVVWPVYEYDTDEKAYGLAASISIDGEVMTNIGIRTRGNTSDGNWKRQFKLSFDCTDPYTNAAPDAKLSFPEYDSRRFHGTKKLNLRASQNDPTIIREKIASYIMKQAGAIVPRVGFAKLYINNQYWGLYLVVEQIDKTFLDAHLNEKSGNLYKGEWVKIGEIHYGPNFTAGNEDGFILQTNKELGDKSGLTAWFGGLAASTTPAQLASWVDVDNVLSYYAGSVLTGHWDSFTCGPNNDHLYHHSDGKFRIITWDVDNTFGSEWTGSSVLESSIYMMQDTVNYQTLFKKLLDDPTTRARYQAKLQSLLTTTFNTAHLFTKIDQWKSTIQSAVLSDPRKHIDWGEGMIDFTTGNSWWQDGFIRVPEGWSRDGFNHDHLGLKPWIEGRIARVTAELNSTALTDLDGNTFFTTAAVLTVGTPAGGGISSDIDSDYYVVSITSNETYQFLLRDMTGDFDLTVYNSGHTQLGTSATTGSGDEEVSLPLTPGTYYLKVTPKTGASGSYTVEVGNRNTIEVAVSFGSGFTQITAAGVPYWIVAVGTPITIAATATDSNSLVTNVTFGDQYDNNWGQDASDPFEQTLTLPWDPFMVYVNFSLRATAYNTNGQSRTSLPSPAAWPYIATYQDAQSNGDGTYTFRVKPEHIGGTNGHRIYLAGAMNGWGNTNYTAMSSWELTNRGDGVYTLVTTAFSGDQYKFNIDLDNNGVRNNSTDWKPSPANPYRQHGGDWNSIIP